MNVNKQLEKWNWKNAKKSDLNAMATSGWMDQVTFHEADVIAFFVGALYPIHTVSVTLASIIIINAIWLSKYDNYMMSRYEHRLHARRL